MCVDMRKVLVLVLLLFTASGCTNQYVLEPRDSQWLDLNSLQKKQIDPDLDPYNEY